MTEGTETVDPRASVAGWADAWTAALSRPSVRTFETIAGMPEAGARRGVVWVWASATTGIGLAAAFAWLRLGTPWWVALSAVLILPLLPVVWLLLTAGGVHLVARQLGGTGSFGKLVYAFAASGAPITLLAILVLAGPAMFRCLLLLLAVYSLVLNITAVQAVHQLVRGQAIAAAIPIVLMLAVIPLAATAIIYINRTPE